jgi:hypothetical protein
MPPAAKSAAAAGASVRTDKDPTAFHDHRWQALPGGVNLCRDCGEEQLLRDGQWWTLNPAWEQSTGYLMGSWHRLLTDQSRKRT